MTALGIPLDVVRQATQVAEEFRSLTGVDVDAAEILTGRAALMGLPPPHRVSAGGATHLLRASDTWCAITLSRADDILSLAALVEAERVPADYWPTLHRWVKTMPAASVVARTQLLDIPAATLGETAAAAPRVTPLGARGAPRRPEGLLVVDLTSMWAGPLCGHLLHRAGATVVKVESPTRPDGTRAGNRAFFDWMNSGKFSVAIDFDRDVGRLRALLTAADVVIEGSRPSALLRRGLGPRNPAGPPGRVWLRISGYGYGTDDDATWRPAFGDDAAVSGGLVGWSTGGPTFCGDAIADPLTGLATARAAAESLARGGGELVDVSMAEVAASYAASVQSAEHLLEPSCPPTSEAPARDLGADDETVSALLAVRVARRC